MCFWPLESLGTGLGPGDTQGGLGWGRETRKQISPLAPCSFREDESWWWKTESLLKVGSWHRRPSEDVLCLIVSEVSLWITSHKWSKRKRKCRKTAGLERSCVIVCCPSPQRPAVGCPIKLRRRGDVVSVECHSKPDQFLTKVTELQRTLIISNSQATGKKKKLLLVYPGCFSH